MKSILNRFSISLLAFVAIVTIASCKKDSDHDHDGHGHVHIHFVNKFGLTEPLDSGVVHTAGNGRDYTIDLAQYYVSNVRLVNHDGTEVPFDSLFLLAKTNSTNELELSDIPAGHYTQLRFDIGLDSATNHADPSTYAASHPLAPQAPGMHWSWNTGYIFVRIDGTVDTSVTKNGPLDYDYNFHLGTDAYVTTVSLAIDKEISSDSHPGITVNLNAAGLFSGIDIGGTENGGHMLNMDADLAGRFQTNLRNAFTAE